MWKVSGCRSEVKDAALRRAGHETVLVTDAEARPLAERLGVEFVALPGSARSIMTEGAHGWDATIGSGRLSPRLVARLARLNAAAWHDAIAAASQRADIVVSTILTVQHAASAAQDRGVPLAFAQLQPALLTRDYPPPLSGLTGTPRWLNRPVSRALGALGALAMNPVVDRLRRASGRPPLRLDWDAVALLMAWSPTLLPAASDWDHPDFTITGDWRLPADTEPPPDADLTAFLQAGEPPVYVGLGSTTGFRDIDRLRHTLLAGLDGRRIVLADGWAEADARGAAPNVHRVGYVPYAWLFPRCAAIVHHCGAGATHAAARSGTPSLPLPFLGDQPFWARRLRELGIASDPLDPRRPTPAAVREAAMQVTAAPVRRRAEAVAAGISAEPDGADRSVTALERVRSRWDGRRGA